MILIFILFKKKYCISMSRVLSLESLEQGGNILIFCDFTE
jgi:hypothetical protein